MKMTDSFKLAIICGGPSKERGISLNSARSVLDHLQNPLIEIIALYVDSQKKFFQISPHQLYSNTPADFDFKLQQTATELNPMTLGQLLQSVDLVFPVIHGTFGEDGELQALLEHYQVPFVAHSSACCQVMFNKYLAAQILKKEGFDTLPQLFIKKNQTHILEEIESFFKKYHLQRAVVKPTIGGSSIGVYSVRTPQEAYEKSSKILEYKWNQSLIIEPFCIGIEFTIIVFENQQQQPVALIPTEIALSYENDQIFDYRKKYLPTNQAAYHNPPRFSVEKVQQIRSQAEQIFKLFGMRDFVRLDGWITEDEKIYFTDINPLSGLEQNSFIFRQASLIGMTHRDTLEYIVRKACQRYHQSFPQTEKNQHQTLLPVHVLFGNSNAERQVSLMSGTNVWLKLLQSSLYQPTPFLFDFKGHVWKLPYSYTLNHTVEEIYENCMISQEDKNKWQPLIETICKQLGISSFVPCETAPLTLIQFFEQAKDQEAFVFIALHGGEGENGTLQQQLENHAISFNGSNASASALCMDKYLTGQVIQQLNDEDLLTIPKKSICFDDFKNYQSFDFKNFWNCSCEELQSPRLIIKPRHDGCSAGIVLLTSAQDLENYYIFIEQKIAFIPPYSFVNQAGPIEMPTSSIGDYLLEPYIETDEIIIQEGQFEYLPKEGWIELTVGVLEKKGEYSALNPSITIAEGSILSVEEKFQGGTGINLTPPPADILSDAAVQKIKSLIEKAAKSLGIQNYARLDVFFNRFSEKMILIEANTLPALTPSTVIYHQGLAEKPILTPVDLLDKIISSKLNRC